MYQNGTVLIQNGLICIHRYVDDGATQGRSLAVLGTTWGVMI